MSFGVFMLFLGFILGIVIGLFLCTDSKAKFCKCGHHVDAHTLISPCFLCDECEDFTEQSNEPLP